MASLAVFKNMYDSHQDIFSIISEFCRIIIFQEHLKSFDVFRMADLMRSRYGFELPNAILKTSIKRLKFLDTSHGTYTLNSDLNISESEELVEKLDIEENENEKIYQSLFDYASNKLGASFESVDKKELKDEFCSFTMDSESSLNYRDLISGFIVSRENDSSFQKRINQIKQGMIIYAGLTYNTNGTVNKINSPLYIYLDTEILFHLYGLNGELFRQIFNEFYELIKNINEDARRQNKKKLIHLRYFQESKDEVNQYFKVAEDIVAQKIPLDPSKQAMTDIVNSCKSISDVEVKRTKLFMLLDEMNICLDNQGAYYDRKENYQYNIDDAKLYEGKTEQDVVALQRKMKLLNYINIKRGGRNPKSLNSIGHILLTANSMALDMAKHDSLYIQGNIPLASGIDFLTTQFWLSQNRGLTNNMKLLSTDVLVKAKIALSADVQKKISELYEELRQKVQEDGFDIEEQKRLLIAFQQKSYTPDKISSINEDDVLAFLSHNDLEKYKAELNNAEKNREQERLRLTEAIEKSKEEIHQKESQIQQKERDFLDACRFIQESRQKEVDGNYSKQKAEYDKIFDHALRVYRRRMYTKSILKILFFIVVPIVVLAYTNIWIGAGVLGGLVILSSIAAHIIQHPVIQKMISMQSSFSFVFSKKYREREYLRFSGDYKNKYIPPFRKIIHLEDIEKEVRENGNIVNLGCK